jgi:hypothetical protein
MVPITFGFVLSRISSGSRFTPFKLVDHQQTNPKTFYRPTKLRRRRGGGTTASRSRPSGGNRRDRPSEIVEAHCQPNPTLMY